MTNYYLQRTESAEGEGLLRLIAGLLEEAGVSKSYAITTPNGQPLTGVEVHPWRCGNLRLLGLHRNYSLNIGKGGDDDSWEQKVLRGPLELKLDLKGPAALYNTRNGKFLGKQTQWTVTLNDTEPVILSFLPEPVRCGSFRRLSKQRAEV